MNLKSIYGTVVNMEEVLYITHPARLNQRGRKNLYGITIFFKTGVSTVVKHQYEDSLTKEELQQILNDYVNYMCSY